MRNSLRLITPILIVALGSMAVGCKSKNASRSSARLQTEEQKASYYLGMQMGKALKGQKLKLVRESVISGVSDQLEGKEPPLSVAELQSAIQNLRRKETVSERNAAEETRVKGQTFLEANRKKKEIHETSSGLQYEVIKEGRGRLPTLNDRVKVHYRGALLDGTEFDSSFKRNQPAEFQVSGVIRGWTEALTLMKVGSKWKLFIPSQLAYGDIGRPQIPPGSVLIFELELLEIVK